MTATLRAAGPADVGAIAELWRAAWDEQAERDARLASGPMADLVIARWVEEWLGAERVRVVVAEDGEGRIVGYAVGMIVDNPPIARDPQYGYVADLAVAPSARLQGTGRRLAEDLVGWFRARGLPYTQLQVSVRNEAGRAFWRRAGFGEFLEILRREH